MPELVRIRDRRIAGHRQLIGGDTAAAFSTDSSLYRMRQLLAQIALNAQFSSQASFTLAFHRAIGMTPKQYQRCRF